MPVLILRSIKSNNEHFASHRATVGAHSFIIHAISTTNSTAKMFTNEWQIHVFNSSFGFFVLCNLLYAFSICVQFVVQHYTQYKQRPCMFKNDESKRFVIFEGIRVAISLCFHDKTAWLSQSVRYTEFSFLVPHEFVASFIQLLTKHMLCSHGSPLIEKHLGKLFVVRIDSTRWQCPCLRIWLDMTSGKSCE